MSQPVRYRCKLAIRGVASRESLSIWIGNRDQVSRDIISIGEGCTRWVGGAGKLPVRLVGIGICATSACNGGEIACCVVGISGWNSRGTWIGGGCKLTCAIVGRGDLLTIWLGYRGELSCLVVYIAGQLAQWINRGI